MNKKYFLQVLSMLVLVLILIVGASIMFPKEKKCMSVDNFQFVNIFDKNYNEHLQEQERIAKAKAEELRLKKQREAEMRVMASRSTVERKEQPVYSTDLKVKSNLTAEQLEKGLLGNLKKYAKNFIEAEDKYEINALLLASISAQESGYGSSNMAINKNNIFGFGSMNFKSKVNCIDYVANFLDENYLSEDGKYYHGTDLKDVNVHYCKDGSKVDYEWSKKVKLVSKDIYKRALE